jgi:hypothetical protein
MFAPTLGFTTTSNQVAAGLTYVSATEIDFQGDVDDTGVVSDVVIQEVPAGGPCPCIIQRGTIKKPGATPLFYTELNNVMNTAVFTAYLNDGTPAGLPIGPASAGLASATGTNVTAIGVTLWVRGTVPDQKTGAYPTVTMVSQAKIDNN